MSETYEIVCDRCLCRLWIGQAPYNAPERFRIYGREDGRQPLAEFLIAHEGHPLRFFSANAIDAVGGAPDPAEYLELSDAPGLPLAEDQGMSHLEPEEIEAKRAAYLRTRGGNPDV